MMKKHIPLIAIIILILIILIGGATGYRFHKKTLKQAMSKQDSILAANERVIAESTALSLQYNDTATALREQITQLRISNSKLYETIKQKERELRVIDTGFMVNARRISESSSKFYQE